MSPNREDYLREQEYRQQREEYERELWNQYMQELQREEEEYWHYYEQYLKENNDTIR